DLPADADRRLAGVDAGHVEESLGVVVPVLVAEPVPALRDQADAAPFAVAHLEHVLDEPPRRRVPLGPHAPGVLVLDLRPAGFELPYRAQHAFEQVERLEP